MLTALAGEMLPVPLSLGSAAGHDAFQVPLREAYRTRMIVRLNLEDPQDYARAFLRAPEGQDLPSAGRDEPPSREEIAG